MSTAHRFVPRASGVRVAGMLLLACFVLPACAGPASPAPTASPAALPSAQASPLPSPRPFVPDLQYYLSPRAQLVAVTAADTDSDAVDETIILYRDSAQPGAAIRGLIAEPPTAETPTPPPTADGLILSDVYWLGGGQAAELLHDGEPGFQVADVNGDGRAELLLKGMWDEDTSIVHVFQWDGAGYTSLLAFSARGEVTTETGVDGALRFIALQRVFPRSGIVTHSSAEWKDGRYQVRHQTTWEAEPIAGATYPEAALVHYYEALAAGDWPAAYAFLGQGMQSQIASSALGERLASLPDLLLEQLRLSEVTADTARAEVDLDWSDPASAERRQSIGNVWELGRQEDGWKLVRLNGTPAPARWDTFTTKDGLTENRVVDLLMDGKGRLWIACGDGGISVWDGSYWMDVRAQDQGLPSNTVNDMLLDSSGRLWFATPSGVASYDGLRWVTYTAANGLPSDMVNSLAVDRDGAVWAATTLGVAILEGEQWQQVALPAELAQAEVTALTFDLDGLLWLGFAAASPAAEQPLIARREGMDWRLFGAADGFVGSRATGLAVDPSGVLWAATASDTGQGGSLGAWTHTGWEVWTAFGTLVDVPVYDMVSEADGGLWIGTARGAAYGDGSGWTAWGAPQGLASAAVHSVLIAPGGVIYFGTDSGLVRLRKQSELQVIGGGQ